MPWVGFEPTIPVFERAKTVHALNSAATVIGVLQKQFLKIHFNITLPSAPRFPSWYLLRIFLFIFCVHFFYLIHLSYPPFSS
jgi:hypothetical protein